MDKDKIVLQAIESLKACPFKTTAIKVELEANLDRSASEDDCLISILENVRDQLGIDSEVYTEEDSYDRYADAHDPLPGVVFARFYNDGSVDSELTFTISLKDPKNILMLPMFIKAFNDLAEDEGGMDVSGAGMHMALLNSRDGSYPCNTTQTNSRRFESFSKSMQLLLPSLYFLASHNGTSRALEYRKPMVRQCEDHHGYYKFNAISYNLGALEFRVFETCYDKPQAIFDNLVVMANCMKYWKLEYVPSGLETITNSVTFGNDYDDTLLRFYSSTTHLDLLDKGLLLLKPSYYTLEELKEERGFDLSPTKLIEQEKEQAEQASRDYDEYIERRAWQEKQMFSNYSSDFSSSDKLNDYVRSRIGTPEGKTGYIRSRLKQIKDDLAGQYTLAVS